MRTPTIAIGMALASLMFTAAAGAQTATSIQAMNDASNVFPAIKGLIREAHEYVHLATWGFDDELRFDDAGEIPILMSRQNPNGPGGQDGPVEDLGCDPTKTGGVAGPADPSSAIVLLRCKASELANLHENAAPPAHRDEQRGEVMVLVWNNFFDDPFNASTQKAATNLDDLAYIWVPTATLLTQWKTPKVLHDAMRKRGSGESLAVLANFQKLYTALLTSTTVRPLPDYVPMPTGIYVLTATNWAPNVPFGSHHQKLLTTETGAYVGGLNFLKEYFDKPDHPQGNNFRFSSGGLAAIQQVTPSDWQYQLLSKHTGGHLAPFEVPAIDGPSPDPLHDTGAIVRGELVGDVNGLFSARWKWAVSDGQGIAAQLMALSSFPVPPSSVVPRFTAYGRLKQVLDDLFAADKNNPSLLALDKLIDQIGKSATGVSSKLNSQPDPNFTATSPRLRVSAPAGSYAPAPVPDQIRREYRTVIGALMHEPGSFIYFENQFFHDFAISKQLFTVCVGKRNNGWCDHDNYGIVVIPYAPLGFGVPGIDDQAKKSIVFQEMQNLAWLEVKTARQVINRTSGTIIILGMTWPPSAADQCACAASAPYVHFKDPVVDADPSRVALNSVVEMMGDIAPPTLVKCVKTQPQYCPTQPPQPITMPLEQIMADGAIRSFVLVKAGAPPLTPIPGNPVQTYSNFVNKWSIYIHSKHTEITDGTKFVFVIGSANINPRSLSFLTPAQAAAAGVSPAAYKLSFTDAPDSESAVFWQPKDLKFAATLWTEHMGLVGGQPPVPPQNAQDWFNQGKANWLLIRSGGTPAPDHRVVRLDVIQRCKDSNGC
jgi:phosphatidylserine/phosphatidylglycerophosphate/cardiolipin synthase-like enzyme